MAIPTELRDKVTVGAGSLVGGIGWGYALRARPDLGTMAAVMVAGAGLLGSTMVKGLASELLTGIACSGLTTIGAMVPDWVQPTTARQVGRGVTQLAAGHNPPLLAGGISVGNIQRGVPQNARIRVI